MMMNKVRKEKFYDFEEKKINFLLILFFPVIIEDDQPSNNMGNGIGGSKSMDSINSYGNGMDDDQGDDIEKARLISQVLELQNTLDDLNQRGR